MKFMSTDDVQREIKELLTVRIDRFKEVVAVAMNSGSSSGAHRFRYVHCFQSHFQSELVDHVD